MDRPSERCPEHLRGGSCHDPECGCKRMQRDVAPYRCCDGEARQRDTARGTRCHAEPRRGSAHDASRRGCFRHSDTSCGRVSIEAQPPADGLLHSEGLLGASVASSSGGQTRTRDAVCGKALCGLVERQAPRVQTQVRPLFRQVSAWWPRVRTTTAWVQAVRRKRSHPAQPAGAPRESEAVLPLCCVCVCGDCSLLCPCLGGAKVARSMAPDGGCKSYPLVTAMSAPLLIFVA